MANVNEASTRKTSWGIQGCSHHMGNGLINVSSSLVWIFLLSSRSLRVYVSIRKCDTVMAAIRISPGTIYYIKLRLCRNTALVTIIIFCTGVPQFGQTKLERAIIGIFFHLDFSFQIFS